jgi:hypothetical protein
MAYKQPSSGPFKMMGSSPAKQRFGTEHHEKTEKVLKAINPVIQTGKFLANSSKSTDKALKKEGKEHLKKKATSNFAKPGNK